VFTFEDCELDPDCYELRRNGDVVHVEPQVFAVLLLLVRHRDRVVRQAELLDRVWGNRCVTLSALTSRVKAARRAIGDDGTGQRMIRTVRGIGYRFVAPIDEHPSGQSTGSLPQDIRFCRGRDSVRIAVAALGAGPVLVKAANWMTHLGFDVDNPFWRHWLAGLSTGRTLVRYDARGCGLSSWEVARLGFEEWVQDLELVVDALGLQRFPLIGLSQGGAVAIGYAARHPERVSHLVLVGACTRGATALAAAQAQQRPPLDELPRRTTSPVNTSLFREELARVDVRRAASDVRCPTLVLHSRGDRVVPLECAGELAAAIPQSRLVSLPSSSHLPSGDEAAWPVLLAEVRAFLARDSPASG
jgi:pimeloyl-ACP methyl ester carboxylesterase/DNA-binding winged helix-turn-helix (wHTH) protein